MAREAKLVEKKERVKGLERLLLKAQRAEKALADVEGRLRAWDIECEGSVSEVIEHLVKTGFSPPKTQAPNLDFVDGQKVTVKPEALAGVYDAFFGPDADGDELDNLIVVKVTRKGNSKNSPRQIVCQAADGTRVVLSPKQLD